MENGYFFSNHNTVLIRIYLLHDLKLSLKYWVVTTLKKYWDHLPALKNFQDKCQKINTSHSRTKQTSKHLERFPYLVLWTTCFIKLTKLHRDLSGQTPNNILFGILPPTLLVFFFETKGNNFPSSPDSLSVDNQLEN